MPIAGGCTLLCRAAESANLFLRMYEPCMQAAFPVSLAWRVSKPGGWPFNVQCVSMYMLCFAFDKREWFLRNAMCAVGCWAVLHANGCACALGFGCSGWDHVGLLKCSGHHMGKYSKCALGLLWGDCGSLGWGLGCLAWMSHRHWCCSTALGIVEL